jgi:hypothetical protein
MEDGGQVLTSSIMRLNIQLHPQGECESQTQKLFEEYANCKGLYISVPRVSHHTHRRKIDFPDLFFELVSTVGFLLYFIGSIVEYYEVWFLTPEGRSSRGPTHQRRREPESITTPTLQKMQRS